MPAESTVERQEKIMGPGSIARLQQASVAVLGVGLLGGAISAHLSLLRVPLLLVDSDSVNAANLANQGFPASRVGDPKVAVRRHQLSELSPHSRVTWRHARLEELGLGTFADVDLIVAGLDSKVSRVRVAEISMALGIPWLDLAVDGSGKHQLGHVTLWEPRRDNAPCYGCRFSKSALSRPPPSRRPGS